VEILGLVAVTQRPFNSRKQHLCLMYAEAIRCDTVLSNCKFTASLSKDESNCTPKKNGTFEVPSTSSLMGTPAID